MGENAYRAIADPTRRAILDRLRGGPANASALAGSFVISRPAISKHLRVLREANLVVDRAIGRQRLYQINAEPLAQIGEWLEDYRVFWHSSLDQLKQNLEEES